MLLVGKVGREYHVLQGYVRQTSRNNVARWLYETVLQENLLKYNIAYYIEGLFAQDEFVSDFDEVGDSDGFYIPVQADKESKGNKFDRIESMAGYFERGNIFFNKALQNSPDFVELINQTLAFQKGSGAHDDAPDALQSAIAKLNALAILNATPAKTISRKKILKDKQNRY